MATKKPCPGCGQEDNRRLAAEVCAECKAKLKGYDALVAQVHKKGLERVVVPECDHWLKHIGSRKAETIYHTLLLELALQKYKADLYKGSPIGTSWGSDMKAIVNDGGGLHVVYPEGHAAALNKFWLALEGVIDEAKADGLDKGSDLLGRLMDGEISNSEINERQKDARG